LLPENKRNEAETDFLDFGRWKPVGREVFSNSANGDTPSRRQALVVPVRMLVKFSMEI